MLRHILRLIGGKPLPGPLAGGGGYSSGTRLLTRAQAQRIIAGVSEAERAAQQTALETPLLLVHPTMTAGQRLMQNHFGMMRAIAFNGGRWHSFSYCAWRIGRTHWASAERRRQVHEVWLNDDNRGRHLEYITQTYGPNRHACIVLCEDLIRRGFVERLAGSGFPSTYALTARGREVINGPASKPARRTDPGRGQRTGICAPCP
ncbi:hypothetical protein [Paraburkholderia youngii]|uniref:hypothetical protein n=1 Tax=Paraburkholderia youngii TaxID=2782701 RepID=UPI003D1FF9BA